MAVGLLSYDVSDLCLGKPPLRALSAAKATVADVISALNSSHDCHVSIWSCDHSSSCHVDCICVGKICMVDVICYLCEPDNLSSPATALKAPVAVLLSKVPFNLVRHVDPSASILEAIELILEGTQNLVVPIKNNSSSRRKPPKATSHNNGREYCWLTQEDVIRFLLSSIGLFSPIAALSIGSLGLISDDYVSIAYHSPASAALPSLSRMAPVAVLDSDGASLVGEISPLTLSLSCGEAAAAAVATLSAGDLMAYIDCGGPPEDLLRVVHERLKERNIEGFFEYFFVAFDNDDDNNSSCNSNSSSSDEDESSSLFSPTAVLARPRTSGYSSRMGRRAEAMVCHRESSLVAVMIQAIAHRVDYVWVVEEDDCSLVGIVTFSSMLEVLYEHLQNMV